MPNVLTQAPARSSISTTMPSAPLPTTQRRLPISATLSCINPGLATDDPPRLSDATDGLVAVNFILTKSLEFALYDLENLLDGETIIINTFPTKRLSIELDALTPAKRSVQ
ncbi:MAG: hypothetical protein MZV70_39325 [Desulfobacterales bacterium]|nr:hypothetical protein [Desulfobacterales bacterium]